MIEGSVLYSWVHVCVHTCVCHMRRRIHGRVMGLWLRVPIYIYVYMHVCRITKNLFFDSSWVETNDLFNCLPRQRLAVHRVGRVGRVFLLRRIHACHLRSRIHACHLRRRKRACHMRRRIHEGELVVCFSRRCWAVGMQSDSFSTCVSCEEEDTCMSYEEEDTYLSGWHTIWQLHRLLSKVSKVISSK